jgi:outer membrane protein OmpA-like peptidoglycan-associated protein
MAYALPIAPNDQRIDFRFAATIEETNMKRACLSASALLLLVLTLGLTAPAPASAGSAPPSLTALIDDAPYTEAIPEDIFADPGFSYLNRFVFRYEMVHFNVDSSVLLPGGKRALHRKIRWLQEHPEATVVVEGHCDARGTAAYNKQLGARRAEATRAFLIEQGIAPRRIQVVSLGKERPDVPGSGARIWFYNRRAEFLPR